MRVYLDLCCLKRPFDDQTQPRIHSESEAVLAVITRGAVAIEFIQAPAQHLENEQNPVFHRANMVRDWLNHQTRFDVSEEQVLQRTKELMTIGFKNFDAFHVASAELAGADRFITCDDQLLSVARRSSTNLRVTVNDPISFAKEVLT